jgi:DNA-binding FadR family transcriptional regulator
MSSAGEFRSVVRRPAYLQVADQLRDAILEGRLAPGDEVPTERELTAQFAVSRTTVREALRALQAQGLVTARPAPSRPIVSAPPSPLAEAFALTLRLGQSSVLDVIQLRSMLELEAIDHAVLDRDAHRWGDVAAALERMRSAVEDPDAFHAAYTSFHVEMVRGAANTVLDQMLAAVLDALDDHLRGAFRQFVERGSVETVQRLTGDHAELLDALRLSDGPRARAALGGQNERFYTQLLETAPPRFPVEHSIES